MLKYRKSYINTSERQLLNVEIKPEYCYEYNSISYYKLLYVIQGVENRLEPIMPA